MPWQQVLTLVVVVTMVVMLAREVAPPAFVMLGATLLLMVTGVIGSEEALAGFGNAAPLTVAALYVLARAVEKNRTLQPLIDFALVKGGTPKSSLIRLLLPLSAISAFINNTPLVAVVAPQISTWANRLDRSASRYLMPITFGISFGGMITLIGTSSNVAVSGLMESAGMEPMGMFELTPIGLPVAVAGLIAIVVLAPFLLPERRSARQQFTEGGREFLVAMRVTPRGPLDGVTVEAGGLRQLQGVYLAEIERGGQVIAPVAPTEVLHGGDRLSFVGRADLVRDLHLKTGLVSAAEEHFLSTDERSHQHTFFEVVVSPVSPIAGRTLKDFGFRGHYLAAVIGIHRAGEPLEGKLGEIQLRAGDTLMLLSDPDFAERWRDSHDFLVIAQLGGSLPPPGRDALTVALVTLGVVVLAGAGILPMLQAALLAAMALIVFGVLTPAEARDAIDLDVIVMIAASFGVAAAIEGSGLARTLADEVVAVLRVLGPPGILLGVVVAEILLTQFVTNTAAAVLLFPIATSAAASAGLDPRPFVICLAIAASASFATPIAYQTNLMIYGPGGYKFGDYARFGVPLTIVAAITIVVAATVL